MYQNRPFTDLYSPLITVPVDEDNSRNSTGHPLMYQWVEAILNLLQDIYFCTNTDHSQYSARHPLLYQWVETIRNHLQAIRYCIIEWRPFSIFYRTSITVSVGGGHIQSFTGHSFLFVTNHNLLQDVHSCPIRVITFYRAFFPALYQYKPFTIFYWTRQEKN